MSETITLDVVAVRPEKPIATARPLPLSREMSVAEAFRAVLLECRDHIVGNVGPMLETRDIEGLHQLRIGLRRLNIALGNFPAPAFDELRQRAKTIFVTTGPARDLDVFLATQFEPVVAELEPQQGFAILRMRAEQARARAWDGAVAQISDPAFAGFLDEVAAAADRWPDDHLPIIGRAPAVLDQHLSRARRRGRGLKTMHHDGAHRLRISLKKLRYSADFFASLYRERPVQRYLGEIKKLQDVLGALNDAAQVRGTLGRLMMGEAESAQVQADLSFAAGLINGWHHAGAARLKRKAHKLWRTLKNTEPFWA